MAAKARPASPTAHPSRDRLTRSHPRSKWRPVSSKSKPSAASATGFAIDRVSLSSHARAIRSSDLILAGGAAGVAAAFNTPLAGIVFAVEELGRRLEARTSGVLVSTIIMSGLVAVAVLGNYSYFGHIKTMGISHSMIIPVLASAVSCGILGGAFSRMMLLPVMYRSAALWKWRARYPVAFAGICGALVAAIGLASGGTSFGSGYAITSQIVAGQIGAPWHAPIMRFLATIISYYSGIPGGIFAPSLAIGAALGSNVAAAVGVTASTISIIALCMTGFLAAVTQAPITAAIIVMEMTDGHGMVISLMAVALFAKAISSRISPELYQHLALDFLPKDEVNRPGFP
ncbi:MAG: chloride channel protein, partial [Proteobacteria bacterium]|nr:chloride channel protein [Pseudomonadota bacterium]